MIDFRGLIVYTDLASKYSLQVPAVAITAAARRIGNPVQIRNGTATVSAEVPTVDESRSLAKAEKAGGCCGCVSQEICLKEVKPREPASTGSVIFCCGKSAAALR